MKNSKFLIIPLLILQLVLLINLQFTAWPEMFSYAYLKNNGFLLYHDIIHPYPPLLSVGLAYIYKIFGYKIEVLQAVAWIIISFSSVFVYLNSLRLIGKVRIALLATGLYVLLQPFLDGDMLWFDIAIVLPILIGTYFSLRWIDKKGMPESNLLLVGLSFGTASLIKQTAGIFALAFLVYLIFSKAKLARIGVFILGTALPWLVFLARIAQEKQLLEFWNWTIYSPLFQWKNFPGYVQMSPTTHQIAVLILLIVPVLVLLIFKSQVLSDKKVKLVLLFLLAGLAAIYPRFSFFHFQPSLIFFVLLYGVLLHKLNLKLSAAVFSVFLLLSVPLVFKPVLANDWQKESRFYGSDEIKMATLIKESIGGSKNIFLLGLPSQYYVMTNTTPPKPWTDNFGWYLEIPGVQEGIIARWDTNPPDYIFWRVPSSGNWFDIGTYQPKIIVNWILNNYTWKKELSRDIWLWEKKR